MPDALTVIEPIGWISTAEGKLDAVFWIDNELVRASGIGEVVSIIAPGATEPLADSVHDFIALPATRGVVKAAELTRREPRGRAPSKGD